MPKGRNGRGNVHVLRGHDLFMARAQPATEDWPEDWSKSGQAKKTSIAGWGRVDPRELAHQHPASIADGWRPGWLEQSYLPQVVSTGARTAAVPNEQNMIPLSFSMEWPELAMKAYPFSTIGMVETPGKQGSGALVGKNIVLTCSHGIPWDQEERWLKFTPAKFDGDEPFGNSYGTYVTGYRTDPSHTDAWDFAVVKLADPLGDRCGYLGYHGTTDDNFYLGPDTWITAGYPGTSRPQTEFLVDIDDVDDSGDASELETPWNSIPGWSGGPLFGWINNDAKAVGTVSGNEIDSLGGWISQTNHGVFAGGLAMARLISWARANW